MINMQSTAAILAALVCVVSAQSWLYSDNKLCRFDPGMCRNGIPAFARLGGRPGDATWSKPAPGGNVFGTLGSTDQGLFGRAGYKGVIFNDARGTLEGQAHGTRVLGATGDSSHLGGGLNWSNKNANAAVDVSQQIGGPMSVSASGAGKWHPDKNTEISATGSLSHTGHGKPDVAVQAQIEHKF